MYALNRLSPNKKYLISSYPGEWTYSRTDGENAFFYKFLPRNNNRRVSIKLPLSKVEQFVWEQISLTSNLEAFRGE
jgi:hypothetical protein